MWLLFLSNFEGLEKDNLLFFYLFCPFFFSSYLWHTILSFLFPTPPHYQYSIHSMSVPPAFLFTHIYFFLSHHHKNSLSLTCFRSLPHVLLLLQVLKNPIVFMVVVGLVSHFALGQKIPLVLVQFIDGLADSFGGAALFYLGLTMVGWPSRRIRRS